MKKSKTNSLLKLQTIFSVSVFPLTLPFLALPVIRQMTANVVPLKYDTSVSPLLVYKTDQSCSTPSPVVGQLSSAPGSLKSDSGCFPSPCSVSYDVSYDYRCDRITVTKIETFSSPEPSPEVRPIGGQISDDQTMDVRNGDCQVKLKPALIRNTGPVFRSDDQFEWISAQTLMDRSERRLKRSVTFREDTIDINEEMERLRPEVRQITEENSSDVSVDCSQQSYTGEEVINLTPISLTVIILLSVSLLSSCALTKNNDLAKYKKFLSRSYCQHYSRSSS